MFHQWLFRCFEDFSINDTPDSLDVHPLLPDNMKSEVFKMFLSLFFLLAIFLIGAYVFKTFLKSKGHYFSNSSTIQILEKHPLTPKISIYLLRVANKTIVIAASADKITLLTELPSDTVEFLQLCPEEKASSNKLSMFLEKTIKKLQKTSNS